MSRELVQLLLDLEEMLRLMNEADIAPPGMSLDDVEALQRRVEEVLGYDH